MTKCLGENNFWDWQNLILALIHFWTRLVFWNSRTIHPIFMKTFFYIGYYINFTRFTGISDPIVHLFYRGRILLFVRVSRIRQIWMLQTQILVTSLNTLRTWFRRFVAMLQICAAAGDKLRAYKPESFEDALNGSHLLCTWWFWGR